MRGPDYIMNTIQKALKWTCVMTIAAAAFASSANMEAQQSKVNKLSKTERKAGWKLLFNGKKLNKWRNYKKKTVSDGWAVTNGAFVRAGKGAGDIITKNQYDSFELQLGYKIS